MSRVCVLGNGPSLKIQNLPPNTPLIGCNRSYEVVWAPIWCTVDYVAFECALEAHRPPPEHFYVRTSAVNRLSTPQLPENITVYPEFRGNSGLFALRVAMDLGYEEILMLGFDPFTHDNFYGQNAMRSNLHLRSARKAQRKAMWKMREDERLFIWRDGDFHPLGSHITWDQKGQHVG